MATAASVRWWPSDGGPDTVVSRRRPGSGRPDLRWDFFSIFSFICHVWCMVMILHLPSAITRRTKPQRPLLRPFLLSLYFLFSSRACEKHTTNILVMRLGARQRPVRRANHFRVAFAVRRAKKHNIAFVVCFFGPLPCTTCLPHTASLKP